MLSLLRAGLEEVAISNERELWEGILFDPLAEHITRPEVPGSVLQAWAYSACASGVHALICAAMDLADACDGLTGGLVLGVDSLSAIGSAGFVRSGAATARRCNPFRKSRDGMMVSEGACAMLLRQRPAVTESSPVRILGIGMSCDGGHPTQPDPRGTHLERAIRNAIERAGLHPNDVGAIVAHGTGTTANDNVEAAVFHRIWPEADVPVTSVKGALGHTMGASGLFNCLVAVEACRTGLLPPTAGDISQAEEGLHLVVGRGRQIEAGSPVLVDCSGFGGNNVSIIFG
jgi:3-oxoacyl-(acyl-carrier-protein) synthase